MADQTVLLDVTVQIKPEYLDAFAEHVRRLAAAARDEPGTLAYDVYPNSDRKGQFRFVEEYRDEAAFRTHADAAVVVEFVASLPVWLTEPATVRVRRTESLDTFTIALESA
jgi:quinol monooxygenase YgiN